MFYGLVKKALGATEGPRAGAAARGGRSVADLAAPTAIEIGRDHLLVEGRERVRACYMSALPRHVSAGWLLPLLDMEEPVDVSLHIEPLPTGPIVRQLTRKLSELQSSRMLDAKAGRVEEAYRMVAFEDVARLREALARGDERAYSLRVYVLLRGKGEADLEMRQRQAAAALEGMLAAIRPALYEQWQGLLSAAPLGLDYLGRRRNVDTTTLAYSFPFASSHLGTGSGILYGINLQGNSLVVLDPFGRELPNANKVVFAKSGAGKSYFCKVEALRALLLGIEYYVVDPEHEYRRLCEAVGGEFITLSGARAAHINPFDLPERPLEEGEDVLAERVAALQGLVSLMITTPGEVLSSREQGALDVAIRETYRRAGITREPHTHRRPAPLLADLYEVLRAQGNPYGLADRLVRYVEGAYAHLFREPTSVDLRRPLVAFGVRDLEEELRPIVFYLIADHVWREVRRRPRPRIFLVDEAWTLARHREGARFLSALARRARKHYLGLTVVSQDVADMLMAEEGRAVLQNVAVTFLMRQDPAVMDLVEEVFKLSPQERQFLLSCDKGEGLMMALGSRAAVRIVASPQEHALCTTDPRELAAMQEAGRAWGRSGRGPCGEAPGRGLEGES
ncbi:hypothetical protein HRbin24_00040 [bacterium HR24]|nr:conjugal transfer protein TraC [Chloroflexota bacterium]GBD12040.1 hypothetical protein HRbin24_00040 [bacterium HR24]